MMFNKVTVCLFLAFNLLPLADVVFAETLPACSGMQITESCHANATTLGNETLNTYTVADGAEMQFSGLTVSDASGGAVHLDSNTSLAIIPENSTGYSLFSQNKSNGSGGAIYANENSSVYLENTDFTDNVANDYGGAIYMNGSNDRGVGDLTIINGVFSGNIASEGKGGAIYSLNNKVRLTNVLFEDNQAKTSGNGNNGNGSGGAIDATDNTTDSNGNLVITNSEFTGNQAEGQGGAIYTDSASTPFLVDINIDENYEDNDGVAYYHDNVAYSYGNDADAAGGGFMYLGQSEADFDIAKDKTLIIGNTANEGAYDSIAGEGAIFKRGEGELVLNADNSGFTGIFQVLEGTVTLGRDNTLINVGDTHCQTEPDSCQGIILGSDTAANDTAILNVGSTQQTFKNTFTGYENSTLNIDAGGNVIVNSGYMAGTTTGAGDLTVAENGSFTLSGAQSMGLEGDIVVEQNAVLSLQGDADDLALLQADPQSIVLDGGVLDLSDMSTFNGTTNQINDGLTITGSGGTVIGNADLVTLGAGTGYHIGDGTSAGDGVYAVINAGNGRVTLADNNAYLGTTQIASGTLQVTANSQLGDETYNRQVIFTDPSQASTLEVAAPGDASGQVDTTSAQTGKARDIEMRASGTMQVDDGVTTQWGGLTADSTGGQADVNSTFTKTGNGTLILSDSGSSHSAVRVEQGSLQGGAENIIADASSLYVGENAAFVTGMDQQVRSIDTDSAGTVLISDDTQLVLTHQDTASALDASLFTGTGGTLVNATSGMSLQGTLNTNMSLDALTYLAGVTVNGNLDNSAGTASMQNGTAGDTLTVNGDYTGGGTVVLETELNGDTSATDQLILNGNTSGDTALAIVPVGGIGQATQNGIKVVDFVADPQTYNNAADFHLAGNQQYINMGAYDYSLVQDNQDWYLRSQVVTPDPQPEPDPDVQPLPTPQPQPVPASGGEDFSPVLNPKMGGYMSNLRIANNAFSMTAQDHAGAADDNIKLRVETAHESSTFSNQIDSSNDTTVAQISTNFLRDNVGDGEILAGIVGGYSNSHGDSTSTLTGRKSDNDIQGYAAGLTASWYQDAQAHQGAYLDSWLQYAWFDNSVSEDGTGDDNYHSSGLLASLEGGYRFTLMQGNQWNWTLQPQAQVIYHGVKQKDFTASNQSKVTQEGDNNVQTRLGLRSEWDIQTAPALHLKPFIEANYRHNSAETALNVDGVNFTDNTAKDSAELSAGVSGNLGANTTVWGKIGQQKGSDDFSQTEGSVGLAVRW
ncbi:autotransporter outer membrane beta-barrel domain-containing protein [Rahnella variigena]|uniref:autotransporter outer membrane beta-barrel domain-containing protein n=1 Tax=Rahnella variigena TaxID=574964 RepID=UPI00132FCF49|nr:autotransporter outer membrane beta-barrel domain-containing protein [Rahnella variigena]